MANPYYPPDSRLNSPELYYPKRKPVGKVKIDWSNPLANGLVGCFLMNGVDLVDGSKTVDTLYGYEHDSIHGIVQTGRTDTIQRDRYIIPNDYSETFLVKPNSTSLQVVTGINPGLWTGTQSTFMKDKVAGSTPSGSVPLGVFSTLHTIRKGGVHQMGVNGVILTSTTSSSTKYPSGLIGLGYFRNTGYDFTGEFGFYFLHNRALSDQEIKSLHDDPYQFLIPDRS